MPVADDLRALRDRALTDLDACHDYHYDSKIAWRLVHKLKLSPAGRKFIIRNRTTGTATTQDDLADKARGYVADQLTEATFQQFLAIFEAFLADLLRLWLRAYPGSLGRKQVEFAEILAAPDKETLTLLVVDKELQSIMHGPPRAWFEYLATKAKLGCPTAGEIDRIVEAKATRDVLIHNRGIANKTYVAKADVLARFKDGERVVVTESYHRDVWILIRKVAADFADAAIAKAT